MGRSFFWHDRFDGAHEVTLTRILHLVPSWEHVGALRRIGMLASHLEAEAYEHHVVALAGVGPDPAAIVRRTMPRTSLAAGPRLSIALTFRLRSLVYDWRADIVHAWSEGAARLARVALLGISTARTVEIPPSEMTPAVDHRRLLDEAKGGMSRDQLQAELALPPQARLLGTAGRLTREKCVIELLWALDQIRCVRDDVYLLVIGDGDARSLFERYARLYEVADRVRFLGWRSDSAALIERLDVFCSASSASGASLAMLEAMALGVPVVASDTAAHRALVAPSETGFLVNVRQRSEMARWCLRVLEDKSLAERMTAAAKRRAIDRFPVERFAAACQALYAPRRPAAG